MHQLTYYQTNRNDFLQSLPTVATSTKKIVWQMEAILRLAPASSILLQPLHVGDKALPRFSARCIVRPPADCLVQPLARF